MLRPCHQPSLNRVIVDIIEFLQHHLVGVNLLRVRAFLPYLMSAFGLMLGAKILELIQQPIAGFLFELVENSLRSMAFEISEHAREVGSSDKGMEMTIEDDPCLNF